ncbi:hypothetical protein ACWD3J_32460 [Streptomyces sp. NPDC002755]|uniref:hypothetical protein n=1 Tax=Streptomyces sp. NPDC002884 TaxID=3154544 RepID=UPI00332CAEEE
MHARVPLSAHTLLTLLTVAVLTGCSTAEGPARTPEAEQPTPSARPKAKSLSQSELRALTLQEAELPEARAGGISVQERRDPTAYPSFKPASDPDCQTVHDIRNAINATAVVVQVINWKDGIYGGGVTLASYDDGEAEQLFVDLKRALRSCHTYRGDGWVGTYTSTMEAQKAPEVGDEAVQFREYTAVDLGKRDELSIVVRTGSVIATYDSLEVGRVPTFPTEPITKQSERLRDAQNR